MILVSDKGLSRKEGSDIMLVFSINYICIASPKIRWEPANSIHILAGRLAHAERLLELVTSGKRDDCNFC